MQAAKYKYYTKSKDIKLNIKLLLSWFLQVNIKLLLS